MRVLHVRPLGSAWIRGQSVAIVSTRDMHWHTTYVYLVNGREANTAALFRCDTLWGSCVLNCLKTKQIDNNNMHFLSTTYALVVVGKRRYSALCSYELRNRFPKIENQISRVVTMMCMYL